MAYSHVSKKSGATYYLHVRNRTTNAGKVVPFYFFSKTIKTGEADTMALDALPDGYTVVESSATGLPLLSKK